MNFMYVHTKLISKSGILMRNYLTYEERKFRSALKLSFYEVCNVDNTGRFFLKSVWPSQNLNFLNHELFQYESFKYVRLGSLGKACASTWESQAPAKHNILSIAVM